MRRLFIVHPFVQAYRRGFYSRLDTELNRDGLSLQVIANKPPPKLRERQDAISASWTLQVPCQWVHVLGRDVAYRNLSKLRLGEDDLIIVEQALKNLETLPLLFGRTQMRVAMWGQGRTYSTRQNFLLRRLKMIGTRQADWFFAYTKRGAEFVVSHGFPEDRVTTLNNTIDTDELGAELSGISEGDVADFLKTHRCVPGATALFVGGVDASKGIHFLLNASREIQKRIPDFRLLVAGHGSLSPVVRKAEQNGYPIAYLGRIEGRDKALALRASDLLLIPEWIGLVAVDALVAGRPIVSTEHHSHSPEHEYLHPGKHVVYSPHVVGEYAALAVQVLQDRPTLAHMQAACMNEAPRYSLDNMVKQFRQGVSDWANQ